MEFQFNFSIDSAAENRIEADGNGMQGLVQESLVFLDKQENTTGKSKEVSSEETILNQEHLSEISSNVADNRILSKSNIMPKEGLCLKCAKEHNLPEDFQKLFKNKVLGTLPPDTRCVNISMVETAPSENAVGEDIVSQSVSSHSDLISGVYEGGLKIWECTFDLMDYLSEAEIQFAHKLVLDLGCGAGLLGIVALKRNAEQVHFQDYNSTVIEELTMPNVLVNCGNQGDDVENTELSLKQCPNTQDLFSKCKFFSGEWSEFSNLLLNGSKPLAKYDLILTSETIYNPDYYEALHETLLKLLRINGCVYLASKAHYFGCGGGVHLFTKFIEKKNVFKSRIVKVIDKGLKRFVIELVFKKSC
ncbi:histidine protein methyltransferase 1 homolog [Zootoca vivipara]|uniref:histidine protein methyltransferase 1 homolog n=1 Tax=Zootoca vivipara TaxID=8524 RepID=UPI00293C086B|nr:histidine protein methyltransferase 1 homolog [Zootoca vivipara]XP_034979903.2 histidine protein methyltransferase 1 homolog [Zootoca vivipara]XP_034979904.2 histidine protein methyltransferase 1 homolog [Zootoca vivipara]